MIHKFNGITPYLSHILHKHDQRLSGADVDSFDLLHTWDCLTRTDHHQGRHVAWVWRLHPHHQLTHQDVWLKLNTQPVLAMEKNASSF